MFNRPQIPSVIQQVSLQISATMDNKNNPGFMFLVLFLCLYQNTHISLASDAITTNQSLSRNQTIISSGGDFELGFFKPDELSNYYIGIWYYKQLVSEKTVVWVASREQSVSDRFSSVLRISDGNLVLFNESNTPIWSTNVTSTTSVASSVEAVLLDNGNLVLRAGSNSSWPLWQSFDHQDHTWLPGSRMGFNTITKPTQILTSLKNSRRISLQCQDGSGFVKMSGVFLPAGNLQSVEVGKGTQFCESMCSNNCSCTAFTYDSNQCTMWSGDLLGLQELPGLGSTIYIKIAAAEITRSSKGGFERRTLLIALLSATAALLATIFGVYMWKKASGNGRKYGETTSNVTDIGGKNDTELPLFGLRTILAATNNFSEANKLGEGGFGPVYKGFLTGNLEVAIKRLSKKSGQGHQEFMNELKLIAGLQHTNLVKLLGCCTEEEEIILIYEYMPNRSLDTFLFNPLEKIKLDWDKRVQIVEGIAQGILYIHKYSRLRIIHRDLKASNILLDGTMKPKVSDFGMARIFGINQTEANTNRVVGTYGYMSPEYARYGHFSEKLDVFSFGVLLLEIISGRRNGSFYHNEHSVETLAGWAWELWKDGRGMEVVDASVRETCQPNEALRCIHIGFLCVQEAPDDRPTMSSVIDMLQGNEDTSLPPSKEPAFSTHKKSNYVVSSSQAFTIFSNNAVTISIPEGR